jgi:hypothetical protein
MELIYSFVKKKQPGNIYFLPHLLKVSFASFILFSASLCFFVMVSKVALNGVDLFIRVSINS